MRFSLRHLEIFAASARHGSISAAAIELGMSQSAASTALIELERRYDRALFDRAGKRLRINETGRRLLPDALELLGRASEIDALLAGRAGPGPIRLGATQTIGNYVAPHLIEAYVSRYPGCVLSLEIGNTTDISSKIIDYSVDVALIEGEYVHEDLVVTDWLDDDLVVICSPSHELAVLGNCRLEDVLARQWVVRERGSGTRQALDRAMLPHWSQWRIALELQQIEAILETVAISRLIGCTSRLAAEASLSQGRVVELRISDIDLRRRFYIALHRNKYVTAGIRAFFDICRNYGVQATNSPASQ